MIAQEIWLTILAISTPIAGIIGFAIQLRDVKGLRLENQKLGLEISELERNLEKAERLIVSPTNEEIEKYAYRDRVLYSIHKEGSTPFEYRKRKVSLQDFTIIIVTAAIIGYLAYDIYRLIRWLWLFF